MSTPPGRIDFIPDSKLPDFTVEQVRDTYVNTYPEVVHHFQAGSEKLFNQVQITPIANYLNSATARPFL
jgi:hypothetical protein